MNMCILRTMIWIKLVRIMFKEHEYTMCISMYQINYGIIRMDVSTLLTLIGIELAMITLQ